MSTELIDRARTGDETAFRELVAPHQRELHVHCYRILGSVADAEDAVQETLVTAWRSLGGFEGRASVRTWMYRIATTRCLNILRSASRRPAMSLPSMDVEPPEPSRLGEVVWLAMRFVAGGDLRQVLLREGPLPPGRAAGFISPVASALDAAHRAGLVHRDVKPANILVDAHEDRTAAPTSGTSPPRAWPLPSPTSMAGPQIRSRSAPMRRRWPSAKATAAPTCGTRPATDRPAAPAERASPEHDHLVPGR